ncbi:MAG: HepT-like ribonuclease domain-containing protein [Thermoanaerobaculia bacterium]
MQHDDGVYIQHMLETARRAVSKVEGFDRSAYDVDENLRLAVTHLVQVIGEAARTVSPATRERLSTIPWTAVIGMRHVIVHDYLGVDEDIVWQVVSHDLVPLIAVLEDIERPQS